MEAMFKIRRAHRHGPWSEGHRAVRVVKVLHGDHEEGPEGYERQGPHWAGGHHEERHERFAFHRRTRGGHGGPGDRPGGPWGRRGGPRVGRGDVRAAILLLLAERALHGYQIIQEIGEWSGGLWRPSPGSVYPALQLLEDEGLIRAEQEAERRVFHLTEAGRAYVETHRRELTAARDAVTGAVDEAVVELRDLHEQLGAALMQVARAGTPRQIGEARDLLAGTRRTLYRILAGDESRSDNDPSRTAKE